MKILVEVWLQHRHNSARAFLDGVQIKRITSRDPEVLPDEYVGDAMARLLRTEYPDCEIEVSERVMI